MNQKDSLKKEQGIGLTALIIIFAVLSIGSFAAVEVYQNTHTEILADDVTTEQSTLEDIARAKTDARASLEAIETKLQSGASVNVDAVQKTIADIRVDLRAAYAGANAGLQTELSMLESSLTQLETEVRTQASDAARAAGDAVATFDASLSVNSEAAQESTDTSAEIRMSDDTQAGASQPEEDRDDHVEGSTMIDGTVQLDAEHVGSDAAFKSTGRIEL